MFRLLKRLFTLGLLIAVSLISICLIRYHVYFSNPDKETMCNDNKQHTVINDREGLTARFAQALKFKTISRDIGDVDTKEIVRFTDWIKKTYPTIHTSNQVKLEHVANYSLLYTIKGSDPKLKPYLLCSHLDVVPVDRDKWTVEPFDGVVKDGYLYGRGAIDVKDAVIGILEALEHLLKNEKFRPKRTILIAFGHDEEISGLVGATAISRLLQSRYSKNGLEFIYDEGSFIMMKAFPGVHDFDTAFVAVTEKGYLTVELEVKDEKLSGHSSMPPPESAIVKLAKAVTKLGQASSFPSHFGYGPEVKLMETLSSHAQFPFNYIYSNLWLFGFFVNIFCSNHKMGNSLIRTTSVATVFNSGFKENVLPDHATALINHRIHPLDTVSSVLEFDRKLINDDSIRISAYKNVSFEPHPISPHDNDAFGYNVIARSVQQVFSNTLVLPGIMVASTDTKHYLPLSKSVYRFTPIIMDSDEIKRFHGHDERIKIDNYLKLVNFYHHVMIMADKAALESRKTIKDEL